MDYVNADERNSTSTIATSNSETVGTNTAEALKHGTRQSEIQNVVGVGVMDEMDAIFCDLSSTSSPPPYVPGVQELKSSFAPQIEAAYARLSQLDENIRETRLAYKNAKNVLTQQQIELAIRKLNEAAGCADTSSFHSAIEDAVNFAVQSTALEIEFVDHLEMDCFAAENKHDEYFSLNVFPYEARGLHM